MYSYISGVVTEKEGNYITLELNNIGYKVFVPNANDLVLNDLYKLYIYNHIKEDEYSLYGFTTKDEYNLFILLITVKGLGPKMALSFFTFDKYQNIVNAVINKDIDSLKKLPKVGEKLANQIIIDLSKKLGESNMYISSNTADLVLALENLGYNKCDINKYLVNIDNNISLEKQIIQMIKLLKK